MQGKEILGSSLLKGSQEGLRRYYSSCVDVKEVYKREERRADGGKGRVRVEGKGRSGVGKE